MADKTLITKPVAAALGVAFVSSLAVSTSAVADDNPFAMADLDSGYLLADSHEGEEGKCGEGKCGEKGEEGSCGEKGEEGSCGEKGEEGKCGEKGEEGKCGGSQS
jgi:uncharacterized low-complexity protein